MIKPEKSIRSAKWESIADSGRSKAESGVFHRIAGKGLSAILAVGVLFAMITPHLHSQPIPHHKVAWDLHSGSHDGSPEEVTVTFTDVIRVEGAPWLRLHIGSCNLGEGSYLVFTSLKDNAYQRMKAEHVIQWRNSTAFFNGDGVRVELHVASYDSGIFVHVNQVTVGDWVEGDVFDSADSRGGREQCGPTDDRIPSARPAVGRFVITSQARGTGWITSNGAHLTAGHVMDMDPDLLEFNVPASLPDGTPQFAPPDDQYALDPASIVFHDNGMGDDWAVFDCFLNPNTGLCPVQAQNDFFRLTIDDNPVEVRVTGYGRDFDDLERNRTQQTHFGDYLGEDVQGPSDVTIEYIVDTEAGNSGSPVYSTANDIAIGIHTHAGCNPPTDGNNGTGFENDDLADEIETFPGLNTVYVDAVHPDVIEDGTVFRPFSTVADAVAAVVPGGRISIVTGSYDEVVTIDFQVTLDAPVGNVVIGQ